MRFLELRNRSIEDAERRSLNGCRAEVRAAKRGKAIEGYAVVWGAVSDDLGGFRERFEPGAFAEDLAGGADPRAFLEHDRRALLGRRSAGTLELREDDKGLGVTIYPGDTTAGRDAIASLDRGDLDSMSFGFYALEETSERVDGEPIRVVHRAALVEVSIVSFPAYLATEVGLRRGGPGADQVGRLRRILAVRELGLELAERELADLRGLYDELGRLLPGPPETVNMRRRLQAVERREVEPAGGHDDELAEATLRLAGGVDLEA